MVDMAKGEGGGLRAVVAGSVPSGVGVHSVEFGEPDTLTGEVSSSLGDIYKE